MPRTVSDNPIVYNSPNYPNGLILYHSQDPKITACLQINDRILYYYYTDIINSIAELGVSAVVPGTDLLLANTKTENGEMVYNDQNTNMALLAAQKEYFRKIQDARSYDEYISWTKKYNNIFTWGELRGENDFLQEKYVLDFSEWVKETSADYQFWESVF